MDASMSVRVLFPPTAVPTAPDARATCNATAVRDPTSEQLKLAEGGAH